MPNVNESSAPSHHKEFNELAQHPIQDSGLSRVAHSGLLAFYEAGQGSGNLANVILSQRLRKSFSRLEAPRHNGSVYTVRDDCQERLTLEEEQCNLGAQMSHARVCVNRRTELGKLLLMLRSRLYTIQGDVTTLQQRLVDIGVDPPGLRMEAHRRRGLLNVTSFQRRVDQPWSTADELIIVMGKKKDYETCQASILEVEEEYTRTLQELRKMALVFQSEWNTRVF